MARGTLPLCNQGCKSFGLPCTIFTDNDRVLQGEQFAETKKRIQERLNVPDKDFAKFKFALIQSHVFKQPTNLNDGE